MAEKVPNIAEDIISSDPKSTRKVSQRWWSWFNQLVPPTVVSATITTAKLTGGGANGSMTFKNGILVAQTPAT